MSPLKEIVPVGWYRVAVASQLFMEWSAGFLLYWALGHATLYLERPTVPELMLQLLGYAEVAYALVGLGALLYCVFLAKPPTEADFQKSKWWQAWALAPVSKTRAVRRRLEGSGADDEDSGVNRVAAIEVNPATGFAMVDNAGIDTGGFTYGTGPDNY